MSMETQTKKQPIKFIIICVILAGIIFGGYVLLKPNNLKGRFEDYETRNILGSSANLVSVPRKAVFANNTTTALTGVNGMTDSTSTDDANLVTQRFFTPSVRKGIVYVSAIGPTATSTLYFRIMGSFDGESFFNIATSTDNRIAATSTISEITLATQWDPGVATNTMSFPFSIDGYRYIRIIPWSEGWTGHLDTGVQAWAEFVPIQDL